MKKIVSIILIILASFSLFAATSSSLDLVTTISQANTLSFVDANDGAISEVNFTSVNTATVKVALWTNKAVSPTVSLPKVNLTLKPMFHESVYGAYLSYKVDGISVNDLEITLMNYLFSDTDVSNVTKAQTYYQALNIELDAQSKADALSGNYLGSLTVTVIAD